MNEAGYLGTRRFSPTSLGATIAINGGILALLLTMASGVVLPEGKTIIDLIRPTTEKPKVPPPVEKKQRETKIKKQTEARTQIASTSAETQAVSDNPFAGGGTATETTETFPPIVPPTPLVIEIQPPPAHVPVKISARIDTRAVALQPPYPSAMQREGKEGVVVVRVRVGTDGRVLDVHNIRSDNPAFFEATRTHALRKWRFKPATEDGVPVEAWREMTVRFEMPRADA